MRLEILLNAAVAVIREHADELTQLDSAIGDADHGINMKRGFDAIDAAKAEILAMPLGSALQKMGMTLVMTVGGASGPLYGSLLMGFKGIPENPSLADVSKSFDEAVEAVKRRGKSTTGEKTMLEVLVPVGEVLRQENVTTEMVLKAAAAGLESTRNMQATKGRASFLGERSIGHLDPGARSSYLLVRAICECVKALRAERHWEKA
jgi:phosphoenolpyruvate---glycerone phosphotransferase subunit DhaL